MAIPQILFGLSSSSALPVGAATAHARFNVPPVPNRTVMATSAALMTFPWVQWEQQIVQAVNAAPQQITSVSLTGQASAITTTAINQPSVLEGTYRATYYVRKSQAATTNSTLTVTLGWTDGGVDCTGSGAALTLNTTAANQQGSFLFNADEDSDMTYAVAYGSTGAQSMQFDLTIIIEAIP